jgi:hypothetical protein
MNGELVIDGLFGFALSSVGRHLFHRRPSAAALDGVKLWRGDLRRRLHAPKL